MSNNIETMDRTELDTYIVNLEKEAARINAQNAKILKIHVCALALLITLFFVSAVIYAITTVQVLNIAAATIGILAAIVSFSYILTLAGCMHRSSNTSMRVITARAQRIMLNTRQINNSTIKR